MDVFQGPATQDLGEERGEGVVYSVALKRVRYGNQTTDPGHAHLQWASQKVRTVHSGTLEKLIEHLAPHPDVMEVSHAYRTCFLCTYRSFAETGRVVELLVRRYLACAATPGDSETERASKQTIQQEIISFFHQWLETYPQDFSSAPLSSSPAPSAADHASSPLSSLQPLLLQSHDLSKTVSCLREELMSNGETSTPPITEEPDGGHSPQDKPSESPLFSLSAEEFSNALTSEDARLFLKVCAPQCLDYIRSPKDTTNAPSVRACIEHFNRVSLVVMATVLGGVAPDARAFIVGQWIDIAHHCRRVKNFSSLKAIVCGLQSTAVFRLRRTWEKLSNSKLHLFQELTDLLSADDNYQSSRDLLNREGTAKHAEMRTRKGSKGKSGPSIIGVVPYLGTFLTDLTMIDSAHQDRTQDGLVNFEKFRRLFQLLAELTLYQKSAGNYCLTRNEEFLRWLHTTHTTSPNSSYELSKQLEPDSPPAPNHKLHPPDSPYGSISPSRIRRGLKQIFNVKVGDYTPPQSPNLSPSPSPPSTLTSSKSARDLSIVDPNQPLKMSRSISMSPSAQRRGSAPGGIVFRVERSRQEVPEGRVVRVAFANSDQINYKSLKLGVTEKTHSIIQQSLDKLGIAGEPRDFNLFQIIGEKHQLIPANSNVYYALSSELHPTLVISRKTS